MVVAAYGLILPQAVFDLPRHGCLNIHASLLPRWRGAAPIQRAILAGDSETGITIMQMDAGLDTGAVLRCVPADRADDTSASLHDDSRHSAGRPLSPYLADELDGLQVPSTPQPNRRDATPPRSARPKPCWISTATADELARAVRAFNPAPGAVYPASTVHHSKCGGACHRPSTAQWASATCRCQRLLVACGSGALCITEVQPAGGKRQSASQFIGRPPSHGRHPTSAIEFCVARII